MKYRLLAPGPTPIPDRVLAEMSKSIIHHRTFDFERIFVKCQEGLSWLLNEKNYPLILNCSGTGAFEAGITNFFSPGDKVLCITGGKFGNNWLKMANIFGLSAVEIPVEWGCPVGVEQINNALEQHPNSQGLIIVANETSTGVRHPYDQIAHILKNFPQCLLVVDAVSALGVWEIFPSKSGIDILIGGSQKGLMLPPGLGFLWASEKAWDKQKISSFPNFYFDLGKEKKAQSKGQTAHTPAVSLIVGLKESLKMMQEEGLENIFNRHERLAQACRLGIEAIGLTLFSKSPSNAITAIYSPPELGENAIYKGLQNLANFTIAGGQEKLAGKIFRIGHMGYVDEIDIIGVLGALEVVLKKLGFEKFSSGSSLNAAAVALQDGFHGKS